MSVRSVQRWRRAWQGAGTQGLRSTGPVSRPKLSEALFIVLEQELAKGPVAHGWPDQTWTLAQIKTLIGRRFHKSMTLSAIAKMLHRCRAVSGHCYDAAAKPTPHSPTPTTSSGHSDTVSARSSTAATSSTDTSPKSASR